MPDDYSILLVDPPEHTRLHKVAARAFTRPRLIALEPTIEALANDIVERAVEHGEVEWIGQVAHPSHKPSTKADQLHILYTLYSRMLYPNCAKRGR